MAPPMQVGGSDRKARAGALGETFINVRDELNRIAGKVKDGLGELNKFAGDVKEFFTKERQDGKISQLGDARQGIISIEIWKNAFADALKRLCPLQGHEGECGCLPVLSRQVQDHVQLSRISIPRKGHIHVKCLVPLRDGHSVLCITHSRISSPVRH